MARAEIDYQEMNELMELMQRAENCEEVINDVLHQTGAEKIKEGIQKLLPISGRTWSGKKSPAKSTQPFTQENGNLSVTIKTTTAYHYLYFPDDGSNTKKHQGNKQFMHAGAESKKTEITEKITEKIIDQIEGGK